MHGAVYAKVEGGFKSLCQKSPEKEFKGFYFLRAAQRVCFFCLHARHCWIHSWKLFS